MKVQIKKLTDNAIIPTYGSEGAAGFDLYADLSKGMKGYFVLAPQEQIVFHTGVAMAIPEGYYVQIKSRSGLASKYGVHAIGGVVDHDYRGEIGVILINGGTMPFVVKDGERIAQAVLQKYEKAEFEIVDALDETDRGEGGFGSTGI
jgi:dUTP pyrophosphatase